MGPLHTGLQLQFQGCTAVLIKSGRVRAFTMNHYALNIKIYCLFGCTTRGYHGGYGVSLADRLEQQLEVTTKHALLRFAMAVRQVSFFEL